MNEPKRMRPQMQNYGISSETDGMLEWTWADEKLGNARNYWISSTRPDGKPHAAPVWGGWIDGTFYFGSEKSARKTRNLLENPYVVVHLESGDDVVILEGKVEQIAGDRPLLEKLAAEYTRKYGINGYAPTADDLAGSLIFKLQPKMALAWLETSFPKTATRFVFE